MKKDDSMIVEPSVGDKPIENTSVISTPVTKAPKRKKKTDGGDEVPKKVKKTNENDGKKVKVRKKKVKSENEENKQVLLNGDSGVQKSSKSDSPGASFPKSSFYNVRAFFNREKKRRHHMAG